MQLQRATPHHLSQAAGGAHHHERLVQSKRLLLPPWVGASNALLHCCARLVWQQALCHTHNLHAQLLAGRHHQDLQARPKEAYAEASRALLMDSLQARMTSTVCKA